MKINLSHFLDYGLLGPADKIGMAEKWGGVGSGWRPRILMLRLNFLYYLEPDQNLFNLVTAARAAGQTEFDWTSETIRWSAIPRGFLLVQKCEMAEERVRVHENENAPAQRKRPTRAHHST